MKTEGEGVSKQLVEDVRVSPNLRVAELVEYYGKIHGFMAGHLWEAAKILEEGIKVAKQRFLAFTGNLIATGLRGVIAQLIDEGLFNIVITTCGAVDHDIARSLGGYYMKGHFDMDDVELRKLGIHRLGNVLIKMESYGELIEKFVKMVVNEIPQGVEWGTRELLWKVGEKLLEDKNSVLGATFRRRARIYVPGITDGAFGTQLFIHSQFKEFKLNLFKDMKELAELSFRKEPSLALIAGGGISKHHTIWWNQFRGGLDYLVYITTAVEWDGSLSGARTREAISWGKAKPESKHVTVFGDATIILPIIATYLLHTLRK